MSDLFTNKRVKLKHDTRANWEAVETTFIPLAGEYIIYDDYFVVTTQQENQQNTTRYPRVKIGTGTVYLADLPWEDNVIDMRLGASLESKAQFWDSKINGEVVYDEETEELILSND